MIRDSKLWTWHVAAGLVVLVFLGLHMTVMHLEKVLPIHRLNPAGGEAIDWANVVARGKLLFFPVTYIILLGGALFHGLYGLKNILFEMNPSRGAKRFLNVLLLVVGIGLFAYGAWAAIAAARVAGAA